MEVFACQACGDLPVGAIMPVGWSLAGSFYQNSNGGGSAGPSFFLLPITDVRLDDNRFTMGLAGTGSKNTVVNNVFVPAHRAVAIADLLVGGTPGAKLHNKALYRQSLLSVLPFCLVAPLLGIADSALADFLNMAKIRTTRGAVSGGNNRMAEFRDYSKPHGRGNRSYPGCALAHIGWPASSFGCGCGGDAGRPQSSPWEQAETDFRHTPAGTSCRRSISRCGRTGNFRRQADPTRVARHPRRRDACEPDLGCDEHHVWSICPRTRT